MPRGRICSARAAGLRHGLGSGEVRRGRSRCVCSRGGRFRPTDQVGMALFKAGKKLLLGRRRYVDVSHALGEAAHQPRQGFDNTFAV